MPTDRPPSRSGYLVEPLAPHHNRAAFTCGHAELDIYLQRQARQHADRGLAAVSILTPDSRFIAGFYTLSANLLHAADLPDSYARKLPGSPLPVTLLGRMAIAQSLQGQHLGELLLAHALRRAWRASAHVASWAVIVDAKAGARDFYLKHHFTALFNHPDRLFLPMRTIGEICASPQADFDPNPLTPPI